MDRNEKLLTDYNDVFADIMNVLLYGGKRVIKEDDLENSKDISQYKADGKLHEQERDVSKYLKGQEYRVAFLGMEHQNKMDQYMPLRVISYDGSAYRSQLLENNKINLYPVITLVLYFGNERWKYGKSLYEVLNISDELKEFTNDYKINLIEVAYLSEKQIEMFQSDFRFLADFFRQKREKGSYTPLKGKIKHLDEFIKFLSVAANDDRYLEYLDIINEDLDRTEGYDMCEVLDFYINKGIEKGKQLEHTAMENEIRKAESALIKEKTAREKEKAAREKAEAARKAAERRIIELEKELELLRG